MTKIDTRVDGVPGVGHGDLPRRPTRVQRKRAKGWRMPDGAIYVGRPTKWGNPFTIADCGDARTAIEAFRSLVLLGGILSVDDLSELRGKDLACWCPLDKPCHADVLLEVANAVDAVDPQATSTGTPSPRD